MVRKWMAPMAAAVSRTMALPVWSAPNPSDQAFDNKIVKRIDVDRIYEIIEELSRVPRVAGTEAEFRSVQYIESKFKEYGYDVTVQPFPIMSCKEPDSVAFTVSGFDGVDWEPRTFTYGVNGDVTRELVYVGLARDSELEGVDLAGKVALVKRGEITFAEKIVNAATAGAGAVVIFYNAPGVINGTLGGQDERFVPALALTREQGEALLAKLIEGERLTVTLTVEGAGVSEQTSHNVNGVKKPHPNRDTGQIVVIGTRHDSVSGAPGAYDASGTAATLELARVLANMPTDTEVRFVTFGWRPSLSTRRLSRGTIRPKARLTRSARGS